LSIAATDVAYANAVAQEPDVSIWHKRLGHASLSKLKHVSVVKFQEVCLTCSIAKSTKLPYEISDSHAIGPFQLVHLDIWRAYQIPAHGRFRYFLTIVDDHTRVT